MNPWTKFTWSFRIPTCRGEKSQSYVIIKDLSSSRPTGFLELTDK
jgi:hypothetical protein